MYLILNLAGNRSVFENSLLQISSHLNVRISVSPRIAYWNLHVQRQYVTSKQPGKVLLPSHPACGHPRSIWAGTIAKQMMDYMGRSCGLGVRVSQVPFLVSPVKDLSW